MISNEQGKPEVTRREHSEGGGGFPWKTLAVVLLLVAGIAALVWFRNDAEKSSSKSGSGGKRDAGPVSVIIGTATQKDVPIYLDGLGTVQAYNTVTVRSRVDGQLIKLAFTEGQDVKAGDLLAQIDPAPFQSALDQALAKKKQDEAQLENARIELKRDGDLLVSKILSQETYDAQKALMDQLAAAVTADQAAIQSAQVQLNYCMIRAPIDGRAGIRFVDEGNIMRSSESNGIVVLTQLRPISIVFTLPEQALREIQQHATDRQMPVLVVDRDNLTTLDEGKLAVIDNQIDTSTGTIRLKATSPNQNLSLWPGQFVNARLLLRIRERGVVVPASVVQRGPEGPYAFVVQEDMSVKMAPVKVSQIDHGEALLDSGLSPGQKVVVDGQYKLQPGSKVKPAEPSPASTNRPSEHARPATTKSKTGNGESTREPGGG